MTGGKDQRFVARQQAEAPGTTRMDLWNKWVFLGDSWKHMGWGNWREKRLDFLHVEWNFFNWALKERIALNADKPGDSWITLWSPWLGNHPTLVLGHRRPPPRGKQKFCRHPSAQAPLPFGGWSRERMSVPFHLCLNAHPSSSPNPRYREMPSASSGWCISIRQTCSPKSVLGLSKALLKNELLSKGLSLSHPKQFLKYRNCMCHRLLHGHRPSLPSYSLTFSKPGICCQLGDPCSRQTQASHARTLNPLDPPLLMGIGTWARHSQCPGPKRPHLPLIPAASHYPPALHP